MLLVATILALVAASAAMAWAWHLSRQERMRSEARVAALAHALDPFPSEESGLFEAPREAPSAWHLLAKLGAGFAVVAGAIVVAAVAIDRYDGTGSEAASNAGRPEATFAAGAPALALLSLSHERTDDQLRVSGTVRNDGGAGIGPVDAVIQLIDDAGAVVAEVPAPLAERTLAPGRASMFEVVVPGAKDVRRYRVSFRGEGGVLRHVDLRPRPAPPAGRAARSRAA